MLAFLDQSGDAGVSARPGSSRYFVLTMVLFADHDEANSADERIAFLRREMSLPDSFEFKFNRLNRTQRIEFLAALSSFRFSYVGVAIDKESLKESGPLRGESLFDQATEKVFLLANPLLETIVLDGNGNKYLRRALAGQVRQRLASPGAIQSFKFQDSRANNLLQLADMVSGAILRSLSAKNDASIYRQAISSREAAIQMWP